LVYFIVQAFLEKGADLRRQGQAKNNIVINHFILPNYKTWPSSSFRVALANGIAIKKAQRNTSAGNKHSWHEHIKL
jgi:hypothetical protein